MRFYDDKELGLSIEPLIGAVRLLAEPGAPGEMTAYVGSGILERVSHSVAKLIGFSGKMGIRHQGLLARALYERGYSVLYVERAHGVAPLGELITEGDLKGHWRIDLREANGRAERRRVPRV